MQPNGPRISELLPRGAITEISKALKISPQAVSKALKSQNVAHKAVIMALSLIEKSGAVEASATMRRLNALSNS